MFSRSMISLGRAGIIIDDINTVLIKDKICTKEGRKCLVQCNEVTLL
jgi:hypothetical protein